MRPAEQTNILKGKVNNNITQPINIILGKNKLKCRKKSATVTVQGPNTGPTGWTVAETPEKRKSLKLLIERQVTGGTGPSGPFDQLRPSTTVYWGMLWGQ